MPADTNERLYALTRFRSVTPGTTDLALGGIYPRSIAVDVSGTVTYIGAEDTAPVTQTLAAGLWHSISPQRITAATATGILVGY